MRTSILNQISHGQFLSHTYFLILFLFFFSCTDPHEPQFLNPLDPNSVKYIPNPPSYLRASFVSETVRRLEWKDNSEFERGFRIERKLTTDGDYGILGEVPEGNAAFTDSSVILTDSTYVYRITALSNQGQRSPYDSTHVLISFHEPTDLHMTCITETSIQLEWKDNSLFEDGYKILESFNNQPFMERVRTQNDTTSYIIGGLNPAYSYQFKVQGFTHHNSSKYSNTIFLSYISSEVQLLYSQKVKRNQGVSSIAFSPDGKLLACGGEYYVNLFRVGDGAAIAYLPHDYNYPVGSIKFSNNRTLIASGHSGRVYLWNAQTFERMGILRSSGSYSVCFTPNDETILVTDGQGKIELWQTNTGAYIGSYDGYNWNNKTIDISPNGQFVATGDKLRILELSDGTIIRSFPSSDYLTSIKFHPSGNTVSCVGGNNHKIEFWNVDDGTYVGAIQEAYYIRSIAFDHSGQRVIASGRQDAIVNIWDVQTRSLLVSFNNSVPSSSCAFSPLNNIVATGDGGGTVRVWGLAGTWKMEL